MFNIRSKLKKKSRLKWARSIREIRDHILISDNPDQCIYVIQKYLNYQENTILSNGQFTRYRAKIITENRTFIGWGNTELKALQMAGNSIYKSRRDFFLSRKL